MIIYKNSPLLTTTEYGKVTFNLVKRDRRFDYVRQFRIPVSFYCLYSNLYGVVEVLGRRNQIALNFHPLQA